MSIKGLWNFGIGQRRAAVSQAGRIFCEAPFGRVVDIEAGQVATAFELRVPIAPLRVGSEFIIELAVERQSALITKVLLIPRIAGEDRERAVPVPGKGHVFPVRYRAVLTMRGLMVWLEEGPLASRDYMLYPVPAEGNLLIGFGIFSDVQTSVQLMGITVDLFI